MYCDVVHTFYSIHPKGIHLASADLLMKEGTNLDHQVSICVYTVSVHMCGACVCVCVCVVASVQIVHGSYGSFKQAITKYNQVWYYASTSMAAAGTSQHVYTQMG